MDSSGSSGEFEAAGRKPKKKKNTPPGHGGLCVRSALPRSRRRPHPQSIGHICQEWNLKLQAHVSRPVWLRRARPWSLLGFWLQKGPARFTASAQGRCVRPPPVCCCPGNVELVNRMLLDAGITSELIKIWKQSELQ